MFGGLRARQTERTISRFRTQKTAVLLAYLAYHRHRSHPREVLIEMLWPEAEAESGRHSLSLALSSLRSQLELPGTPSGSVIVADRWSVELNPDAFTTDVATFEQALRSAAQTREDARKVDALRLAVETYTGPLLPGFYEEWTIAEQERLAERYLQALRQLTTLLEKSSELAAAIEYAHKAVETSPLREETHGELIRLLARAGQPSAALRQYRELERLLDQEFGEVPGSALRQQVKEIERREYEQTQAYEQTQVVELPPLLRPATLRMPTAEALPTGTVTFLLTDIEGSTGLWEKKGEAFRAALSLHHALLRKEFHRHGGYEFKEAGDGFMAAFSSVGDALACAVAGQRALGAQAWPEGIGSVLVRMALHTGDAELEEGDYHGPTLHRASRILNAAHGGQTLCSEATSSLLRRDLETEVRLRDIGVYRLRDVELPERLFQVEFAAMAKKEYPPLRAERAHTGSLPLQFTRFFGREAEMARVQALLRTDDGAARLVTLTGPGGTGKTRLAVETAARLVEAFHGAVWFVPLADIADTDLLPDALLEAMRLPRSPGEDAFSQAVSALSQNPSLLVLDNMEQVVEGGADFVERLLQEVPSLVCLVTSRQLLGLSGEHEFVVPPLPTPGGSGDTPEGLGVYGSVQLFVDRAQAVKPDFKVTNTNAAAVAELCNRLEGIPLAIELAAARALVMTPSQMLNQLAHRFELLVSRKRGVAERQRTLRAAIDWSYRLLSPELQQFFARLCVLRGGWTVEAAEAVTGEPLTLDMLAQLREGSLIQTEEGVAEMRFRMLESIRDFACEQLEADDRAQAEQAHAAYYQCFTQQGEAQLRGEHQQEWLHRLEEAHDNLRAAIVWASQEPERVETHLRLCGGLWYFWSIRGYLTEGRRRLHDALARVPAEHPEYGRSELRAGALTGAGALALDQSDDQEGRSLLEESVLLWRELGGNSGLAATLNLLGNALLERGQMQEALAHYEEALALYRALDDRRGASILLNNLGVLAQDEGDLDRAARLLIESVRFKRSLGNFYGLANSLDSLGSVERSRGNVEQAAKLYAEALTLRKQIGHRSGIAISLNNMGHLALAQRNPESARLHFVESLPIFRDLEENEGLAECLSGLAGVATLNGEHTSAAKLLAALRALRAAEGIQVPPGEQEIELRLIARVRDALGEAAYTRAVTEGEQLDWEDAIGLLIGPGKTISSISSVISSALKS